MSKTDIDLYRVDRDKATDSMNTATKSTDSEGGRSINVFDYETVQGMPFLLAAKYGDSDPELLDNVVQTDEGRRMSAIPTALALEMLHNGKTRGETLNFWYNLNFDINIFLKDLDESTLNELRATNSVETTINGDEFGLTYIPKKMLEIRHSDHVSRHYDLAQFCYGSLDSAADSWLDGDVGKAEPTVTPGENDDGTNPWKDSARGMEDGEIPYVGGAIHEYSDEVRNYAKTDVQLTYDIAETMVTLAEDEIDPEIPFGQPYSTGYVAGDFWKAHMDSKPRWKNTEFQRAALKSYAGGRFEVFERGRIEEPVAGPDINSAYPAVMDSLPDPSDLRFGHISRFADTFDCSPMEVVRRTFGDDYYDLRGFAFVKLRATTDAERRIQPFAVKTDIVRYPALEDSEVWTIGPIAAFAEDAGYLEDYEIIDGYVGLPADGEQPRKAYADYGVDIGGLYAKRKALAANGQDKAEKLVKIILNSMYGKTCQINAKRALLTDYAEIEAENEDSDFDFDALSESPEDADSAFDAAATFDPAELPSYADFTGFRINGEPLIEYYEAGPFFNPAFASYITGITRLKLHESTVSAGLEDDVIMFATDCILCRKEPFDSTALADEADSDPDMTDEAEMRDALGGWDYDYKGLDGALMVASGIYEVYGRPDEDGPKTKARGFDKLLTDDYPTLRGCIEQPDEYLTDDLSGITVENRRPRTFGEVVFQGKRLTEIGKFFNDDRTLSADMDSKRVWKRDDPTFPDLLGDSEYGAPPTANGVRIDDSAPDTGN